MEAIIDRALILSDTGCAKASDDARAVVVANGFDQAW